MNFFSYFDFLSFIPPATRQPYERRYASGHSRGKRGQRRCKVQRNRSKRAMQKAQRQKGR